MQKENLHRYLAQEPVLRALYFAKQQLNGFLVLKSLKRKRVLGILSGARGRNRTGTPCGGGF